MFIIYLLFIWILINNKTRMASYYSSIFLKTIWTSGLNLFWLGWAILSSNIKKKCVYCTSQILEKNEDVNIWKKLHIFLPIKLKFSWEDNSVLFSEPPCQTSNAIYWFTKEKKYKKYYEILSKRYIRWINSVGSRHILKPVSGLI